MKRTVVLIIGTISTRCDVESQSDKDIYDLTCDLEMDSYIAIRDAYRDLTICILKNAGENKKGVISDLIVAPCDNNKVGARFQFHALFTCGDEGSEHYSLSDPRAARSEYGKQ